MPPSGDGTTARLLGGRWREGSGRRKQAHPHTCRRICDWSYVPVRAGPSVGKGKTRDGKRKEGETRCLFVGLFGAHQIRSVDGGFFRFDP